MSTVLSDAFARFEAAEAAARAMVEATPRFTEHPEHRAQAYYSLAEARAMAYNHVIAPRLAQPRVQTQQSWYASVSSLGQNCGDFRYGTLLLDGRCTYRISGRTGAALLALMQINSRVFGHPDAQELGNHDLVELASDGGAFDLTAAPSPDAELRLGDGGLNYVLIRRILGDISDDAGEIVIERVGGPEPLPETNDTVIAERLDAAAHFLRFLVREWAVGLYDMYIGAAGGKNRLAHIAGKDLAANIAGSPSTTYGLCVWELAPDEALVLEWDVPDSLYWGMQIADVWSNALDFVGHQTDVNMRTAVLDPDGRLRVIISGRDTGHANWLDTCGRGEGELATRNYRARGETAAPVVRVVPLGELAGALPADTARVTSAQRAAALAARRARFRAAYGD